MGKWVVLFFVLMLVIPLSYPISIKELIARYSFSTSTQQMDVLGHEDFMVDKNANGINDTLIIEIATSNTAGTFVLAVSLFDRNGILINETNKTLTSGNNKINITFDSILLSQPQFNYSIKIYNSTRSLKYREDNISTQNYLNYEGGFKILDIKDTKSDKTLKINITLNSTINGTFRTTIFLSYNNSIISSRDDKIIEDSINYLAFNFNNETIKRTHYAGKFNISSVKIGKKAIKTDFQTDFYDFRDFAVSSYIAGFDDNGVDANNDNLFDFLRISADLEIISNNTYTIEMALYDLFGNVVEIKNESAFFNSGKNTVPFNINGSRIYGKKLNGPFIVKYINIFEGGIFIDRMNDAYITSSYNFNDFQSQPLPDLSASISVSDGYHYGIENITVNFTFKNIGSGHAFNLFAEMLDNRTFFRSNKSNIVGPNSSIFYKFDFVNISDLELSAFADLQNFIEEANESNNAERIVIKLNKNPILAPVSNITVNETDKIVLNISASDPNGDKLSFSINSSKFSNNSNIFEWVTTTVDSGNYALNASASDDFLSDSFLFTITVFDLPEKDSDNDGINNSIDRLIGDENSINTSTINITLILDGSSNLSRIFNETVKAKFTDNNLTIAEFDFDFSLHDLNLANVTINKQLANQTGSLIVKGIKLPAGITKALYVDRINSTLNGVCIKDEEISAIDEISGNCNSINEFKVECDGTLQNSYRCEYNSTSGKYRVQGLGHSGIMQIPYTKPSADSSSSSASSTSSSGSSGGGGVSCISKWECTEWSECIDGVRQRKCEDFEICAFPTSKPEESEKCSVSQIEESADKGIATKQPKIENKNISQPRGLPGITGMDVGLLPSATNILEILDVFAVILVFAAIYLIVKSLMRKLFK